MVKGILLTVLSSLIYLGIYAQNLDRAYTVEYINASADESCKIFDKKKNFRIEYTSNETPVRIDYIFPEMINYEDGIYYSEDEQAIILVCYEKAGKGIEREILKQDRKILYDRTNFKVACEGEKCKGVETAFKHLIQLYVEKDYERTEPFE